MLFVAQRRFVAQSLKILGLTQTPELALTGRSTSPSTCALCHVICADNPQMRQSEPDQPISLDTPWGPMEASWGPRGLRQLRCCAATPAEASPPLPQGAALAHWLQGYGAPGTRREPPPLLLDFSVGTPLQAAVWRTLQELTWGQTMGYAALAQRVAQSLGRPDLARGVRAVANAVGRNPWWVLVPCHRVVGSDRRLRGYAGGLPMKADLLQREGWVLSGDGAMDRLLHRTP